MTYVLRKLSGREDAVVAAIFLDQVAKETIFTNQYPKQPPKDIKKMVKDYGDDNNFFLGIFDGERMVGSISCMIQRPLHPWCNFNATFGISLLEEVQGKGYASRMIDIMVKWAYSKGLHRIEGRVRTRNERALRLYIKKGFQIEGLHKEDAYINGEWHDSYSIVKVI